MVVERPLALVAVLLKFLPVPEFSEVPPGKEFLGLLPIAPLERKWVPPRAVGLCSPSNDRSKVCVRAW